MNASSRLTTVGTSLVLSLIPFLSASAQLLPSEENAPRAQTKPPPGQRVVITVPPEERCRPGVRYTTGYVETRGWEAAVVKNDSNLSRWTWSPIISFTQSGAVKTTGKGATDAPYSVPPAGNHYIKYTHVPLPRVNHSVASAVHSEPRSTTSTLSGTLSSSNLSGRLAPATTLTYGNHGCTDELSGKAAGTEVHGVLCRR